MNKTSSHPIQVVLITGAGSGIGRAIAQTYDKNGFLCVLIGRREAELRKTSFLLKNKSILLPCDLNQEIDLAKIPACLKSLQDETSISELVLVNNAGIFERHSLKENDLAVWHRMFQTNLFAAVRLTQVVLPFMLEIGTGSVVNISSTLGLNTIPHTGAYSASKAAMNMWSQSLALEMGSKGIRVNTICPGLVDTPIQDFHFQEGEKKAQTLKNLAGLQPLGRIGSPQDIAESAYFLGSKLSAWTTGSILVVDGGINLV